MPIIQINLTVFRIVNKTYRPSLLLEQILSFCKNTDFIYLLKKNILVNKLSKTVVIFSRDDRNLKAVL